MSNLITTTLNQIISFFKQLQVKQFASAVLVAVVLLTTNVGLAQNDTSAGQRMRDRIQQMDQNTERPKTTGQWNEEVRGDVPLNERVYNTVRDSAEAFKQFGAEYGIGAQESANQVQENAKESARNLTR